MEVTGMNAVGVAMETLFVTAGLPQPGQGATGAFAVGRPHPDSCGRNNVLIAATTRWAQ